MKNYEYCFVTKRSPVNANENLLHRLLTNFPGVLFFTTKGHICYLSETDENMVGVFISKPWKNKREFSSVFKCYKLPGYSSKSITGGTTSYVYSSSIPIFNKNIDEPNYIGYIGGSDHLPFFNISECCCLNRNEMENTMSRVYDLLRNEGIIN
jgi:hypothetical protein